MTMCGGSQQWLRILQASCPQWQTALPPAVVKCVPHAEALALQCQLSCTASSWPDATSAALWSLNLVAEVPRYRFSEMLAQRQQ